MKTLSAALAFAAVTLMSAASAQAAPWHHHWHHHVMHHHWHHH